MNSTDLDTGIDIAVEASLRNLDPVDIKLQQKDAIIREAARLLIKYTRLRGNGSAAREFLEREEVKEIIGDVLVN